LYVLHDFLVNYKVLENNNKKNNSSGAPQPQQQQQQQHGAGLELV